MKKVISIVGAGLAGSECALQLAHMGYSVNLYEMRGLKMTPAHKTDKFAEIVCSNSFGSMSDGSAPHQLKWEAEKLNSFILKAAKLSYVPAGQALAVDRTLFANTITEWLRNQPNISIHNKIITSLDEIPRPTVIATGPLTDEVLALDLQRHFGHDFCYFFDAIAPIVDADSINLEVAWFADRYDKGSPDYLNCPLDKEQYLKLVAEISDAKKIEPKDFEKTHFFESCLPIETMIARGPQTLRFGPMKPVGLRNPRTGRVPYAVVQLRKETKEGTAYNLVGFQTRMTYGEQTRILRMIPGLENAEFLKLGSIHRNLYINSPAKLNNDLSSKLDPWLHFAGQITGVEGYFESTCIGLLTARFLDLKMRNLSLTYPPRSSALGSLLMAITDPERIKHFQPVNINFGLFPPPEDEISANANGDNQDKRGDKKNWKKEKKQEKKLRQIANSRTSIESWLTN